MGVWRCEVVRRVRGRRKVTEGCGIGVAEEEAEATTWGVWRDEERGGGREGGRGGEGLRFVAGGGGWKWS